MLEVKRNNTGPYIITICGSLRYTREMLQAHNKLSSMGFMVFLPNINLEEPIPTKSSPSNEDAQVLHDAKISFGDAIFVMNIDGYIGESTFHEWKLARKLGKDIFYAVSNDEDHMDPIDKTRKLMAKLDRKEKKK